MHVASSQPAPPPVEHPDPAPPLVIRERRRPLVARALAFAVLAALAGAMAASADPSSRAIPVAACIALVVATVAALKRLALRPPALCIRADGFVAPRHAAATIGWHGVVAMTPVLARRGSRLLLAVSPGAVSRPSRRRRLALALRLARPDRLVLALDRLDLAPRRTAALFEHHVRTACGAVAPVPFDPPQPLSPPEGRPTFAYGLVALLVAIYAAEVALALRGAQPVSIDVETLLALGGTARNLVVERGQLWRLVTASLLHGGALHIAFNAWAMVLAARLLETRVGWRWFAAAFAVSAVAGSLASVLVNPDNIVGVGASGGIVGLSAATALVAFRFPVGPVRSRMLVGALGILVPSLLPSVLQLRIGGAAVDVAAHAGGALGGAVVGVALLALWPRDRRSPRFAGGALALALAFATVAAGSLYPISRAYRAAEALMPEFPPNLSVARARAAGLLARYPRDPRVRYVHALAALERDDLAGARTDLETALADQPTLLATVVDMDPYLRGLLALILSDEHDAAGARNVLRDRCPAVEALYHDALRKQGLCL